jgi:hypothetical protein
MYKRNHRYRSRGRGAVTVELALLLPIFVAILAGLVQASKMVDAQSELAMAARVGARLATMDRTDLGAEGQDTNDLITDEVRTYLKSNGLPGDAAETFIVDPDDHTTPFDLDDPANDLELFELRVELPYAEISGFANDDWDLTAKVVFRNARSIVVQ